MIEKLYKINEVCEILRITRNTFYNLERSGAIKTVQIGKSRRIKESELKKLIGG